MVLTGSRPFSFFRCFPQSPGNRAAYPGIHFRALCADILCAHAGLHGCTPYLSAAAASGNAARCAAVAPGQSLREGGTGRLFQVGCQAGSVVGGGAMNRQDFYTVVIGAAVSKTFTQKRNAKKWAARYGGDHWTIYQGRPDDNLILESCFSRWRSNGIRRFQWKRASLKACCCGQKPCSGLENSDYWAGYQRGLRQGFSRGALRDRCGTPAMVESLR